MNSIQLTQRLARHLNVPDTFNLSADPALDVLSAMNAGLNTLYRALPGSYKRTTLSHTIRAPRDLALVFQEQYSRLVGDNSFVLRDQGCTVRFADESADNVVTGANSLLDNYLGTELTVTATVYSDAIPIQDVIERIIGNVLIYSKGKGTPTPLIRNERLRGGRAWQYTDDPSEQAYPVDYGLSTIGRPRYYYLEPMGVSQGAEPEFILRISPLPDADYTLRMEAELSTQRLIFADLSTAREISVPSSMLDDILIPLCEGELIASSFWRDKAKVQSVIIRQEKALGKIGMIPSEIGPTSHVVGTPPGY